MPTIEDVEKVWNQLMKYEDEAEQHDFVMLALIHTNAEPFYLSLHENWNEEHAKIFIEGMHTFFKELLHISEDVTSDA